MDVHAESLVTEILDSLHALMENESFMEDETDKIHLTRIYDDYCKNICQRHGFNTVYEETEPIWW